MVREIDISSVFDRRICRPQHAFRDNALWDTSMKRNALVKRSCPPFVLGPSARDASTEGLTVPEDLSTAGVISGFFEL